MSYENNTNADEQDLPGHQSSAPLAFRQLTLVHRHSARVDTSSQASDKSANNQVRKRESRCLQCCADNDETHRKPNHVSAAKHVSDCEVEDATKECAQAVAGHCDSGDNIIGIAELFAEVWIL
jgi:hypothetical protein